VTDGSFVTCTTLAAVFVCHICSILPLCLPRGKVSWVDRLFYGVVECCPPLPSLASAFDSAGRPLEAAFYTGSPAYHNVIYEIYCQHSFLEVAMEKEEGWLREEVKTAPIFNLPVTKLRIGGMITVESMQVEHISSCSWCTLLSLHQLTCFNRCSEHEPV